MLLAPTFCRETLDLVPRYTQAQTFKDHQDFGWQKTPCVQEASSTSPTSSLEAPEHSHLEYGCPHQLLFK